MSAGILTAMLVVLFGGVMEGSFTLPQKHMRTWSWESSWAVYSLVGLALIPWAAATATVPAISEVYRTTGFRDILCTFLLGFGWGVANVCFGIAVRWVGMAISFAIVVGMSAALGSLIPFLAMSSPHTDDSASTLILTGVTLTLCGVWLLGAAGHRRETTALLGAGLEESRAPLLSTTTPEERTRDKGYMTRGILLCLAGGILAPMLNFSFAFGSPIMRAAVAHGAHASNASNAIWAVALSGGFLSNGCYSIVKLIRNRTWPELWSRGAQRCWFFAGLMGVLWAGGLLLYGWGATALGRLGPVIGWPVFQASMILISSLWGAMYGEWRKADSKTLRLYCGALASLVAAIALLSVGNRI
jgi:L-rhamnose-H+ transport protein